MTFQLSVRNLSKAYGRTQATSQVSFGVAAGEVFGLLGPNGAGKTTTVEAILGLVEPDTGEIEVCGVDARRHPAAAKARIGAALQSTGLQDKITPREALSLFANLYGRPADTAGLLARFGLEAKADAAFDSLSGGQRQRVALALAFVNTPDVVVLDEPTASLDPQMRRELHSHIRTMRDEGKAVLLTTHDMEEAEQLCDRIGVLSAGRIVAEGSPRDLIARSAAATRVIVQTDAPSVEPLRLASAGEIALADGGLSFATSDLNLALAELVSALSARGVAITALRAGRATLEDVIIELTGAEPRE